MWCPITTTTLPCGRMTGSVWDDAGELLLGGPDGVLSVLIDHVAEGGSMTVKVEAVPAPPGVMELYPPSATLSLIADDVGLHPSHSSDHLKLAVNPHITHLTFGATSTTPTRFYPVMKDDGTAYATTHWTDVDLNGDPDMPASPVAYRREAEMVVAAEIMWNGGGQNLRVRGEGPEGYDFDAEMGVDDPPDDHDSLTLAGRPLTFAATADAGFKATIEHFDTFDIDWSVSADGGASWIWAGATKNQVYTLLEQPLPGVTLFHTVAHLATAPPVKGLSEPTAITNSIFGTFLDDDVRRVDGVNIVYDPGQAGHTAITPLSRPDGRGQCSALADLFASMLWAHGIDATLREIKPDAGHIGFVVEDDTVLGGAPLSYPSTAFSFHVVVKASLLPDRVFDAPFGAITDKRAATPTIEQQWEDDHVVNFVLPSGALLGSNPAGQQLIWNNW